MSSLKRSASTAELSPRRVPSEASSAAPAPASASASAEAEALDASIVPIIHPGRARLVSLASDIVQDCMAHLSWPALASATHSSSIAAEAFVGAVLHSRYTAESAVSGVIEPVRLTTLAQYTSALASPIVHALTIADALRFDVAVDAHFEGWGRIEPPTFDQVRMHPHVHTISRRDYNSTTSSFLRNESNSAYRAAGVARVLLDEKRVRTFTISRHVLSEGMRELIEIIMRQSIPLGTMPHLVRAEWPFMCHEFNASVSSFGQGVLEAVFLSNMLLREVVIYGHQEPEDPTPIMSALDALCGGNWTVIEERPSAIGLLTSLSLCAMSGATLPVVSLATGLADMQYDMYHSLVKFTSLTHLTINSSYVEHVIAQVLIAGALPALKKVTVNADDTMCMTPESSGRLMCQTMPSPNFIMQYLDRCPQIEIEIVGLDECYRYVSPHTITEWRKLAAVPRLSLVLPLAESDEAADEALAPLPLKAPAATIEATVASESVGEAPVVAYIHPSLIDDPVDAIQAAAAAVNTDACGRPISTAPIDAAGE